jgi:hypothetical protein
MNPRDDNPRLVWRLRLDWQILDLLAPENLFERPVISSRRVDQHGMSCVNLPMIEAKSSHVGFSREE